MAQSFFGGVHPDDQKAATKNKPIEKISPPSHVVLPMSLHIGALCAPCVSVGDQVTIGQVVGEAVVDNSAPIHASVSGKVVAVELRPHFSGVPVMSVVIENDYQDTFNPDLKPVENPESLTNEELVELVKSNGIVGLGGAAIPTHQKIRSSLGKVDTVIINAAECEPYLTSDYRYMLENPEEVIGGCRILARAFGVDRVHIGIEDNKMDVAEILKKMIEQEKAPAVVDVLHTCYPQGAKKQMCQAITGRQAPSDARLTAIGCVMFNVMSTVAIYRAIYKGLPLTHRVVTVSGSGVVNPKNLMCPVGTPMSNLLDACGGVDEKTFKILTGGPMMGQTQYDMSAPVGKGTNGLLAFCKDEEKTVEHPTCIRCGKCISVCPMRLQPIFMYQYERAGMLAQLESANVKDCMECGACTYICPGRLHLVQTFRTGKQKLNNARAAAKAAAKAAEAKKEA